MIGSKAMNLENIQKRINSLYRELRNNYFSFLSITGWKRGILSWIEFKRTREYALFCMDNRFLTAAKLELLRK